MVQQPGQGQPAVIDKPKRLPILSSSCLGLIIVISTITGVGGFVLNATKGVDKEALLKPLTDVTQAKAAEQKEQSREEEAEVAVRGKRPVPSPWDGITPEANEYLRKTLSDYDSLEILECSDVVTYRKDAWGQRIKYKAKNASGALHLEEQLFVIRDGKVMYVLP